jgi:hypothetical protein
MDFLRNHAHLAGGDTRKAPNLANHGIRQEGKGPPHANPSQSRHSLSILSNTNTHRSHTLSVSEIFQTSISTVLLREYMTYIPHILFTLLQ